eukprot:CAMPEP_0119370574 /NCGR_PEP_ID=MMETSP1334-20130426/16928_1 /TAXON_ID=127549 /ORGANISM="Calcidiscus leptoporus, Strain RCC1130" /LENGTH=491 /DNA_ID=CAMNT_0007387667 /DNA_START=191 /DNA_END=1666 /DNA_ORIENTATION=+
MTSVCSCSELDGCGWCSHGKTCLPYPECSTTCEECDPSCANFKYCDAKCYRRFRPRLPELEKDGLFPLASSDIACAASVFLATVFASAAGIGGGAVLVPMFTLLGEFSEHEAIPLSLSTVFGASLFSTFGTYLWLKHPQQAHRPMIAWDVATVLMPATLLGTTCGVFLNKVCPNWLIMILLVLLCAVTGKRTLSRACKAWEKESKTAYSPLSQVEKDGMAPSKDTSQTFELGSGEATASADDVRDALQHERLAESGFPWGSAFNLLRTWLVVMALSLLKGGHGSPSLLGVRCGTLGYWLVVLLNIPVLGALSALSARRLLAQHRRRLELGYEYAEGDVQWDREKVVKYPAIVACAAVAAGMLGVGGGMVLGPIFLELDLLPEVSSATSTLMVLFMSSSTVGQFIVFGMIDAEYAIFFGLVGGVLGAIIGTKGARALLQRTGRASFIIFFLAGLLIGSGVLMVATGAVQLKATGFTSFRPLCGRAGNAAKFD